jgi:hypothetical protein
MSQPPSVTKVPRTCREVLRSAMVMRREVANIRCHRDQHHGGVVFVIVRRYWVFTYLVEVVRQFLHYQRVHKVFRLLEVLDVQKEGVRLHICDAELRVGVSHDARIVVGIVRRTLASNSFGSIVPETSTISRFLGSIPGRATMRCEFCGHIRPKRRPSVETRTRERAQVSIRHHYILMFYSKRWRASDGRICEYSRHRDKIYNHRVVRFQDRLYETKGAPKLIPQRIEDDFVSAAEERSLSSLVHLAAATFPWIIRISCTRLPECHP